MTSTSSRIRLAISPSQLPVVYIGMHQSAKQETVCNELVVSIYCICTLSIFVTSVLESGGPLTNGLY
jgi:hypothetical protein